MSILKYKDPKTGEFKRINPYGDIGKAVEIAEISGETALSDDIITKLQNDANWISYGGGAYRFVSIEEDKRLYAYITEDKISQILINTITKTCVLRETQITSASVADSIVKRDSYGEIPVSTPSRDSSATNKAYVDEADKDLRLKLSNLEQALNGYILDTTKEAYADLDSAVLKDSVAVGDNVYPIADKTRALVSQIEGKTTKMVQLLDKSNFLETATINGVTYTNNGDGSWTLNGTCTTSANYDILYHANSPKLPIIKGHVYLVLDNRTGKINNYGNATLQILNTAQTFVLGTSDNQEIGYYFTTSSETTTCYIRIRIEQGTTYNNVKLTPQLFDLTAMNREDITTVEQFKAEFPDFYPYENGNIYPAKISAVKFYENQDKSGEQASVTLPETYDLHGIGDYKDYLEITKNEDNELYTLKKIQVIDKHVFDGMERWGSYPRTDFTNKAYLFNVGANFIKWQARGNLMNLLENIKTLQVDKKGYCHGDNSSNIFFSLPNIATVADMKAHVLAMYEAGTPYIFYGAIETPVETVIATNLTYEQVTAIRHNGGLIEVEGNTNKAYAKPTIKNTIVYRLTATNTAEG